MSAGGGYVYERVGSPRGIDVRVMEREIARMLDWKRSQRRARPEPPPVQTVDAAGHRLRGTGGSLASDLTIDAACRKRARKAIKALRLEVHLCDEADQPNVHLACGVAWTTPKWGSEAEKKTGIQGVHRADDDRLYSFDEALVTCTNCLTSPTTARAPAAGAKSLAR